VRWYLISDPLRQSLHVLGGQRLGGMRQMLCLDAAESDNKTLTQLR